MLLIKVFLIFLGFWILFSLTSEENFADFPKSVNEYHMDEIHEVRSIEEIEHDDYIDWNYGDKFVIYDTPNEWGFKNNNLLDYGFTRVWNHTMHDHVKRSFNDIPHNWWTGIQVYRIGDIDTISGNYEVEFNYWVQIFEENDPAEFSTKVPEKEFVDFVNMIQQPEFFEFNKGIEQKKHYHEVSVSGTFHNKMNSNKWPFENVELKFIIEPNYENYPTGTQSNSIQFHIWPYPILAEDVVIPGFDVLGYKINVENYQYSEGDEYSRYTAIIEIQRAILSSFLKYVFPICVMAGLSVAVMYFPRGEYMTKIELNAIFLLGILFFVQVVSEEMPAVGGMTIFDFIVMISYAIIIVTILTPARKWWDEKKFMEDMEDYEWWENKHNKKIEEEEMELSNIKLAEMLTEDSKKLKSLEQKKKEVKERLAKLDARQFRKNKNGEVLKELKEFQVSGKYRKLEDWVVLIQGFNDEDRSEELTDSNKEYNRIAWGAISGIITVGVVLMTLLTA